MLEKNQIITNNLDKSTENKQDFEIIRLNLIEIINQLERLLKESSFNERLISSRNRLNNEKMNVLIVGEFSRGKSTFINALLRSPVLPSKVNPTTATINLIEFGNEKKIQIFYRDGKIEELNLPDDKINKFLDSYVTTINKDANNISQIKITYPSNLNLSNCVIVDTPGVNDLDEAREDITYKYLSQADACVIILDSQQPLSESERRFLKDKVLGKDIQRLIFVINRMDEIPKPNSDPDPSVMERLTSYIRNLITENLPDLSSPEIYAIASKPALKARFKEGEINPWAKVFDLFEKNLINFITLNATKRRFPDHIKGITKIIQDGLNNLNEKKYLLNLSDTELKQELNKLNEKRLLFEFQLQSLSSIIERDKTELIRNFKHVIGDNLVNLKHELLDYTKHCSTDSDLINLKSRMAKGIRNIVENITEVVDEFHRDLNKKLKSHFSDALENSTEISNISINDKLFNISNISGVVLDSFSDKEIKTSSDFQKIGRTVVFSAALGHAAAAIIGGPVGIGAAIFGGIIISKKIEEGKKVEAWQQIRQQTIANITTQIDQIIDNVNKNSLEIAEKESKDIENSFKEQILARIDSIKSTLEQEKSVLLNKNTNLKNQIQEITENKMNLESLLNKVTQIGESL